MTSEGERFDEMVATFAEQGMLFDADSHLVRTDGIYLFEDGARMRRWRNRIEGADPAVVDLVDGFRAYYWPEGATDR